MKGFMIYETPLWGDEENVVYLQEVKDASYTLKQVGSDDITCYLEGTATKEPITKATCNKDDTYDFEMGALIALMKKCGVKKVAEACNETFPRETAGSIYRENKRYVKRIKELEEKVDNLYTYNKSLIDEIDQKNHEIISLKALKISNESLKKDNESFRKTIGAKNKDIDELIKRINELEVYNDQLEDRIAGEQRGGYMFLKDMEKLQEKFDKKVSDLRDQIHENSRLIQTNGELRDNVKKLEEEKKHLEDKYERCQHILDARVKDIHRLEEKVEKLKLDCEKLQHGYNDADKESLIWCTSQPSIRDQLDSLIEESKYAIPFADKWLYRIPTKREQMWDDILACDCEHSKYVKVKKEDLETFAKECKEKKIFSIFGHEFHLQEFWFRGDDRIFQIFRKAAGFICATDVCSAFKDTIVDYLPPMRWDLFRKGRIYVKLDAKHFDEFKQACIKELGISPNTGYFNGEMIVINIPKEERFVITRDLKGFKGRKIINWEDVR